jgi:hypothetical protein
MNHVVDLTSNGKIFPLSAMDNLRQYQLKPFGEDNLSDIKIHNIHGKIMQLKLHQAIAGSVMSYKSKLLGMLFYYGLGSGKTASSINVLNQLFNHNPLWNVFILIKASLHDNPWQTDLKKFMPSEEYEERMKNIHFVHYDAPNADKQFLQALRESDSKNQNIYIFDEAHNFIRNVYSNLTKMTGKRASSIYNHIVQEKKNPKNSSRVILLSGTPAINEPFELALMFNLLKPGTFPEKESKFNEIFVGADSEGHRMLKPEALNMFQRRILGLVSYYVGADPSYFPRTERFLKNIPMSEYQQELYRSYEDIERQIEQQSKHSSTYKTYTRQASNFVFPNMGKQTGENRPRPSQFRISEKDAEEIIRGNMEKSLTKKKDLDIDSVKKNYGMYVDAMNIHVSAFRLYLENLHNDPDDIAQKKSLAKDIEVFKKTYKHKFRKFWENHKTKSKVLIALYDCSCKYTAAMFYTLKTKRPFYIFSNFVKMEGLQVLSIYLEQFGYKNYRDETSEDYMRYTEFHGDIPKMERTENMTKYNEDGNIYGKDIKCILIAPAGAEGLSFRYMEMIIVADPYWNEVRIRQLIGRGLRMDSHVMLPKEEQFVEIYRLHAVTNDERLSTDQKIFNIAERKEKELTSFINPMKSASIDCELFKAHNMSTGEYSCFKFNQSSYFNKVTGPAYKNDLVYDSKIKDGLNSSSSIVEKVKTYEISAQIKTGPDEFGNSKKYWYDPIPGIVYDIDLEFPVGRILKTNGIPHKMNDMYIIEDIIDIPELYKT